MIKHPLTGLALHLVENGLLDPLLAKKIENNANRQNISFIFYLVKYKILTSEAIASFCSKHFSLPFIDLVEQEISFDETLLPREIVQRHQIIPIKKQNGTLEIGIADPTDQQAINAAMFYSGLRISTLIIRQDQLQYFLDKHLTSPSLLQNLDKKLLEEFKEESLYIQEDSENYDEPLIKLVDNLFKHAIQSSASDIHIEPYETHSRIRYRQDGILYEISELPKKISERLITRLKVLAKLDISERRLPQDGRFQQHQIDIRINTCPTLFGEKIVLRLLDSNRFSLDIHELGLTDIQKKIFLNTLSKPHGMILVTGPTGSGKTVTLYSALQFLNSPNINISTVEDPVEIKLNGINQVNIYPKIGLTFSHVLRTFLRQDPDVIMVGEIRDIETAEIAIQAAQTGHLVLSTLHTNTAIETLSRLLLMGIPTYHLANSVSLIIAQRLLRILCNTCKQPEPLPEQHSFYTAKGCEQCLQGYQGRIGIYEFLSMTDTLAQLILSGATSNQIYDAAQREGFISLQQNGFEKVKQGVTSLNELYRVCRMD